MDLGRRRVTTEGAGPAVEAPRPEAPGPLRPEWLGAGAEARSPGPCGSPVARKPESKEVVDPEQRKAPAMVRAQAMVEAQEQDSWEEGLQQSATADSKTQDHLRPRTVGQGAPGHEVVHGQAKGGLERK